MRVRATRAGHYGGYYREEGDVFDISDEDINKKTNKPRAFSRAWMEEADEEVSPTPVQKRTPRHPLEVLTRKIEEPRTLSEAAGQEMI